MPNQLGYWSLALYVASFICYARNLSAPNVWVGRVASLLLAAGIFMQYLSLYQRSLALHTVPYDDLYGSMSLFAWLLGVTYLGLELFHRQRSVGAFVTLLLVCWIALLGLLTPRSLPVPSVPRGAIFAFHVTLNTWAYAAFALSFVLSVIYLVQDRVLRSRRLSVAFWRFPALDVLERMARSSVYVGLVALIFGVAMGLIWEHRLRGSYSFGDPKVIITLAILGVYAAYLLLSRSANWRGARAALLCAMNFVIVLFSYTFVNLYLTKFHNFSDAYCHQPEPSRRDPHTGGADRLQSSHRAGGVARADCFHFAASFAGRGRLRRNAESWKRPWCVSTCNRSELYGVPGDFAPSTAEAMEEYFTSFHKIPHHELKGRFYRWAGPDAVRHLFRVAAGLDSMLLGEAEILGQLADCLQPGARPRRHGAGAEPNFSGRAGSGQARAQRDGSGRAAHVRGAGGRETRRTSVRKFERTFGADSGRRRGGGASRRAHAQSRHW